MNITAIKSGDHVMQAIQKASARTGVDFSYMLNQAKAESSLNPNAKAKTSSATGLYQFINSTWLNTVEKHGHKHGLSHLVSQIDDPSKRQEILDLRKDPKIASLMAAELASDNRDYLENRTNADIGATEMYLAHFLGAGAASNFINAMQDNPYQDGATLFPKAAKANKNVFYDSSTGRPRTLSQIHAFFDKKFDQQVNPVTMQLANNKSYTTAPQQRVSELFQTPNRPQAGQGYTAGYMQVINTLNKGAIPGSHFLMNPVELMLRAEIDPLAPLNDKSHATAI